MVQIDYYIKCFDETNEIAKTSYFAAEPITLNDLISCFPFKGKYHFRYKLSKDDCINYKKISISEDYVWVDILSNSDKIIYNPNNSNVIEIQALMIENDIDESEISIEEDHQEYFMDIALQLQEEGPRSTRQATNSNFNNNKKSNVFQKMKKGVSEALTAAQVDQISLASISKGASNIWKSIVS